MFTSHYKDPYEPPLTPKVEVEKPPWRPSWLEYNGRTDWWTDLGYKDELRRKGVRRVVYCNNKEFDKYWWDPKVPDGTSLAGAFGLDSQWYKDYTRKGDQPGNMFEHQKKILENSIEYKNIIKQWNISEEHPGIPVDYKMDSQLKNSQKSLGYAPTMFNRIQYRVGPSFWDKPINEGCISKGFALFKYAALGTLLYAALEPSRFQGRGAIYPLGLYPWKKVLKFWVTKALPVPALLSFTFGVSACTCAAFRNEDDSVNWIFASLITSATYMTLHDFKLAKGIVLATPLLICSLYFQNFRTVHHGVQGTYQPRMFSGLVTPYTGPLNWKYLSLGDYSQTDLGPRPNRWKYLF